MNREIITLPKERWKGVPIPLVTRSDSYYDVEITPMNQEGCTINEKGSLTSAIAIPFIDYLTGSHQLSMLNEDSVLRFHNKMELKLYIE